MKKSREITRKVTIEDAFCDRCGDAVIADQYDAFRCDIELQTGCYDPYEGHIGESYDVDLCENCAEWLFKEVFPKLGITPNDTY